MPGRRAPIDFAVVSSSLSLSPLLFLLVFRLSLQRRVASRLLFFGPFDLSGAEIIHAGNNANFAGEFTKAGFSANFGCDETSVLSSHQLCRIPILSFADLHGRLDVANQRLHMTWRRIAGQRGDNGSASGVTENDDEADAEVLYCVFDAPQRLMNARGLSLDVIFIGISVL